MVLYENEGITDDIRRAFIVYLASHDRPMHEILAPRRLDVRQIFKSEFAGMTDRAVAYQELESVRERLIADIVKSLSESERNFLISIKQGAPRWDMLGIPGIENLPALQWKLANIRKMDRKKHEDMVNKLKAVLLM
jgi:hypothetical protein